MSGDVQPRKRKDKKRKKDELGVEEPRGTAAVLGEGDVFMHSQHDHGTGGHWCAKIIFFSLLAILITLIGLIILENRGLSELEANSVESRYSGVLQGWLEDASDDNHHDKHTLDLNHHDIINQNDNEASDEVDQDNDNDQNNDNNEEEDELDDNHSELDNDDEHQNPEDDDEQNQDDDADDAEQDNDDEFKNDEEDDLENEDSLENENNIQESDENFNEGRLRKHHVKEYFRSEEDDDDELNNNNNLNDDYKHIVESENDNNAKTGHETDDDNEEVDNNGDDEQEDNYYQNDNIHVTRDIESDEDHIRNVEDSDIEIEKIEKEYSDEEIDELMTISTDGKTEKDLKKQENSIVADSGEDDDDFLSPEDIEEIPIVEPMTAPRGKPLVELEDDTSSEKPPNTLAEEEEYEKQQAELQKQKEQASHMWLKAVVGCALLAATHAVMRRFTTPSATDTLPSEGLNVREDTPLIDRRMTLIPKESIPVISSVIEETSHKLISENLEFEKENVDKSPVVEELVEATKDDDDEEKELYSEEDDVDEEVYNEKIELKQRQDTEIKSVVTPESDQEDVPDDVEIIDDEQLEEELLYEDEEEISDVDDSELLSRLEAKYGRLPEPHRPGPKSKDGGNNYIEEEWPGEPSDAYWRQQLDQAERHLREGSWSEAAEVASKADVRGSSRARYVFARALDALAEARRDNTMLSRAITAYLELLKMNERLSDRRLKEIAERTLDRIRFRGNYMGAEPVYRLLIRRFPDDLIYRNNLTITYLMANRPELAEDVLKETLQRWPKDRVALAHLGFVFKNRHDQLEEAVELLQKALEGDTGPANEPRFYYSLGDTLLVLGRYDEANEVHKRGAALGHFLSPAQRSLYNVERLKSQPWWNVEKTPYVKLARALEKSWKEILKEGNAARALYEKEKEGLMERGEWSQLDLFVRGQEIPNRCNRAPVTCSIIRQEQAAAGCRRGQVKFSMMEAGTHVRPHVGPTNCRLRMHLGLSNTKDTFIRVHQEMRQWETGKVLLFDDSFEHEVWHNGTNTRLVLIVDVWHPDLTPSERRQLPAI